MPRLTPDRFSKAARARRSAMRSGRAGGERIGGRAPSWRPPARTLDKFSGLAARAYCGQNKSNLDKFPANLLKCVQISKVLEFVRIRPLETPTRYPASLYLLEILLARLG